jgi:hypothetical protein
MPLVKKNKLLDGPNSIYSASRKVASRQLKNMKSTGLDTGDVSNPTPPISSVTTVQDVDGLIPQLLQNLNDVNGLMSSLKLVGGKSSKSRSEPNSPYEEEYPKKRPREGAGRRGRTRKGGSRNSAEIAKLQKKLEKENARLDEATHGIADAKDAIKRLKDTTPTTPNEKEYLKRQIEEKEFELDFYTKESKKAKTNIKNHTRKIEQLRETDTPDTPVPGPQNIDLQLAGRLLDELEGYLEDARQYGALNENSGDLLRRINQIHMRNELPMLRIGDGFQLEEDPGNGGGEGNPNIPQLDPLINPEEADLEDYEGNDEGEIDVSNFDFSKVSKSTLLVILNQLKSLVKRGDILLKKIVHSNISASEGDLDSITQELSELISSKRFLLNHITQISSKGKEVAEYLHSILSSMVGKYIEHLKTYVKRFAQLNREQINSIQDSTADQDEAVEIGAGRGVFAKGKPVILSDFVRRIHSYDQKYLL